MKHLFVSVVVSIMLIGCSSSGSDAEPMQTGNNASQGIDSMDTDSGDNDDSGLDGINTSDFCPAGAQYDALEDACYIECEGLSDDECNALEDEVFGEFDEFVVDNYSSGDAQNRGETGAKAQYSIQSDLSLVTLENTEPANDELFQEMWVGANKILPRAKVVESFSQYHVDSDGESNTLAYVTGDINEPGRWIIAFDDADYTSSADREFIHTTIHEFGHIVFLGKDQVDSNLTGDCPSYAISEGCSFSASHINRFYQTFWTDIIDESRTVETEGDLVTFYEKYKDRFVSEYAATNPVEDAAEVFTNFVLRDKPVAANTIANQKVLFMHELPELVQLRNDIRGKLTITRARMQRRR